VKKAGLSANRWMSLGIMGLGHVIREYRKGAVSMARIQGAIYYLKAVQTIRSGFLTLFLVLFGLVFLLAGIVMLHFAAYFFVADGPGARPWALLGLGLFEVLISAGFIGWLLSSKRWVGFAMNWNPAIRELLDPEPAKKHPRFNGHGLGLDD
jgi:hypothetical protein